MQKSVAGHTAPGGNIGRSPRIKRGQAQHLAALQLAYAQAEFKDEFAAGKISSIPDGMRRRRANRQRIAATRWLRGRKGHFTPPDKSRKTTFGLQPPRCGSRRGLPEASKRCLIHLTSGTQTAILYSVILKKT